MRNPFRNRFMRDVFDDPNRPNDKNWSDGWAFQKKGKPVTLSFLDRMIKIDPAMLLEVLRNLINQN